MCRFWKPRYALEPYVNDKSCKGDISLGQQDDESAVAKVRQVDGSDDNIVNCGINEEIVVVFVRLNPTPQKHCSRQEEYRWKIKL